MKKREAAVAESSKNPDNPDKRARAVLLRKKSACDALQTVTVRGLLVRPIEREGARQNEFADETIHLGYGRRAFRKFL
jgi:hypothetical protein